MKTDVRLSTRFLTTQNAHQVAMLVGLEGRKLVEQAKVEGTNRVVLLTDGQANVGIGEPEKLLGLACGGAGRTVTTTCIGFGAGFNGDLQRVSRRHPRKP